jgi:branched-chain amino acid transport system ATP-binding protein
VKKALAVADRGYVLERGALVASGSARLLARSAVVREAYLGAADSDTTTAADARASIKSRTSPPLTQTHL